MLNTLNRCLIAGVAVLCAANIFAIHNVAQAESSESLLPLQTRTVRNAAQDIVRDQVADTLNTQIAVERAFLNEPTGMSLESIPILKELVDETGKFDAGVNVGSDLPISVGFGDLMGNGVLMLGTDFPLD